MKDNRHDNHVWIQVDQNIEPFNEQMLTSRNQYEPGRSGYNHSQFSKMYQDSLPAYSSSLNSSTDSMQVQMQQQQMLSPALSFNGKYFIKNNKVFLQVQLLYKFLYYYLVTKWNIFLGSGLELDSPTTMSLPSPGATSCSLDGDGGALSPPASSVSGGGRRESASSGEVAPSLQGRVNVLQQRVSNLMQADRRVVLRDLAATLYPNGRLLKFWLLNFKEKLV